MSRGNYIIKDLENLTGIKSHTIRMWEQRYCILSPKRTDTNIRYYDDEDLKKILNVNLLYQNGHKISKIATLENQQLTEKAREIIEKNKDQEPKEIAMLIAASLQLDSDKIQRILESLFQELGIITMYQNVIKKFLVRIGELWQLNTFQISHEHLFSNTLRDFIISKSDQIKKSKIPKKAMFFLPQEEEHELTLLFYQYLLLDKGWNCIYLGQKVPILDIEAAYYQVNPDIVITSLIKSTSSKQFNKILTQIIDVIPKSKICLSGLNTIVYKDFIPKNVKTIHNLSDFVKIFD